MSEPIKPCPYCKEPRELVVNGNPDYKYVNCLSCEARGPLASNEADAIMLHNAAANALEAAKAERDEAKRIAELRLRDCETMAEEVEKYKGILQGERQQRDEARAWAIKLWRDRATETCPRCEGKGSYVVNGVSKDWMETCTYCNGTGKVTK